MSIGTNVLQGTALEQFLGADGIDELKEKLIDMIVTEVRDQLQDSSEYIIAPDDIANDISDEIIDKVIDEIKDEYKSKLMTAVEKKMKDFSF